MGFVYLAHDRNLDTPVVIKVPRPAGAAPGQKTVAQVAPSGSRPAATSLLDSGFSATEPLATGRRVIILLGVLVGVLLLGFGTLLGVLLSRPEIETRSQAVAVSSILSTRKDEPTEPRKDPPKIEPTQPTKDSSPTKKDEPKDDPPVVKKDPPPKKEEPKVDPPAPREMPYTGPPFERLPGKDYVINSVGMVLVKVPAGTFTMGSPEDEKFRETDENQHEVEITRPFYLGIFSVTQEQYEKVMKKNPSYFSVTGKGKEKVKAFDTRHFPVECVTWQDAKDFCDALSALPEEKTIGRVWRLPTEAEWEYSCRGGAKAYSPFHYGSMLTSDLANYDRRIDQPTTVGSYKPNSFGLYDMHGNVWQWCADLYGPYDPAQKKDPTGPAIGTLRVLRGGSWFYNGASCRSAYRCNGESSPRLSDRGFRVLCVMP